MRASVIINTLNRARLLEECLFALGQQTFQDFEVVVVNGPSEDNTEHVLSKYDGRIKVYQCEDRNLSTSRNLGIAGSAAEVCVFIDDDAVAHPLWLARIMAPYGDRDTSAVGGFTLDHTGVSYQCKYTVCDRLGNPHYFDRIDPSLFLNFPGSPIYPSLLGTNSSFRRRDLERIGGFDEVFAYMLDETDVCLRINDLGGRIVTVPDALVLHRYAPSHTRNIDRTPHSLLASSRSKAYFCFKHRRTLGDLSIPTAEVRRFSDELSFSNRWFVDHEKITPQHFMRLCQELEVGIGQGTSLAINGAPGTNWLEPRRRNSAFTPFKLPMPAVQLRICLVSQGYPPTETAGIARWTAELANGLVALGHIVHVIAATSDSPTVEYRDGVWLHRVPNLSTDGPLISQSVPDSTYQRAHAVYNEARRIKALWGLDILSAPIWDVEGLVCAQHLDVPVVTSLHTTYKLAMPFKEHWKSDLEYRFRHVNKIIDAECWLLKNSSLILANSRAIVSEINQSYGLTIDSMRLATVPHGISAKDRGSFTVRRDHKIKILFVGRLEQRKGIDILLDAIIPVLRTHPDVELHVVGEEVPDDGGFSERVGSIRHRIDVDGLDLRIKFYGYVSDEILNMHYQSCDIFVAPSRFESFGLIAIEAMRYGKPVIASNVGGLGEIFEDGHDGLLFESDNSISLQEKVEKLITNQDLRVQIGLAAMDTFSAKYTVEAMSRSVSDAFASVVFNRLVPQSSAATFPGAILVNDGWLWE